VIPFNPFSALTSKIYGGIAIAALALAFVQTVRIEGFLFIHGYKQDLREADAKIAGMQVASDANRKAAEDQVAAIQLQYDQSAQEAQNEYETQLAAARGSLSDYVRSHRLPRYAGGQCAASGTGEGKDSPIPSGLSPDPGMVAVRETDLQALVDWLAVGVEAHNQAIDKINRGVALPDPAFGGQPPQQP
jgi:hypothetical protein